MSVTGARPDDEPGVPTAPVPGAPAAGSGATPLAGRSLHGMCVLVPRGGEWGARVADEVRRRGGSPLVVPLVDFAPPDDETPLAHAIDALRDGAFDWLVVTSATTVDALVRRGVAVPSTTSVAAVGSATAEACRLAGFPATVVGTGSGRDLAAAWPARGGRVLLPQSDLADHGLADDLTALGATVDAVVAYRTVAIPVDDATRDAVRRGHADAVLVTSGSVAREVADQFGPLPSRTLVACLGPRTAADAEAAGLHVSVTAPERSVAALLDALATQRRQE